jgi:adenylate cyclase
MRSRKRKRTFTGLGIAAVIGIVLCLAFSFNLLSRMQLQSSDFLFKVGGASSAAGSAERIVIVGIDDKTLQELGHFPSWPRYYYADVIDRLAQAEARVIVLDILLSEAAVGDAQMAASIENSGNVILPVAYEASGQDSTSMGGSASPGEFVRPLGRFEQKALALGHASVLPDQDGVVRKVPLEVCSDDECIPALSLAGVAKYLRRPQVIEVPIENNQLLFAGRTIPLDDVNGMLVNYIGGIDTGDDAAAFQVVSFVDTLMGEVDPAVFHDRLVLIGATASVLGDTFWTPMGAMMNGVEIHANAAHTILSGDFLKPAPFPLTIALIMVLAIVCGMVVLRLRVLWATISVLVLFAVYFIAAFSLFDGGLMLNMVYPPVAILGSFTGVNLFIIASERSEKRTITETFGRYLSQPVVEKILKALDDGDLKLGGQQREVTVAFADVRGFTSIAERMEPEDLVNVLNQYLSIVVESVISHEGVVNKFGGDSVMAVWNVPTPCQQHALKAIMAAFDIQREIERLQQSESTLPAMNFHLGINTGRVIAGNMGSAHRLEYSVIGDAVNVAARIAGVAEVGKVWIGPETYELAKDFIDVRPLEPLILKGRKEPIQAYEVIGLSRPSIDPLDGDGETSVSE